MRNGEKTPQNKATVFLKNYFSIIEPRKRFPGQPLEIFHKEDIVMLLNIMYLKFIGLEMAYIAISNQSQAAK